MRRGRGGDSGRYFKRGIKDSEQQRCELAVVS